MRAYSFRKLQGVNAKLMARIIDQFGEPISSVLVTSMRADVRYKGTLVSSVSIDPTVAFTGRQVGDPRWEMTQPFEDPAEGYNMLVDALDSWFPQSSMLDEVFNIYLVLNMSGTEFVLRYDMEQVPIGDLDTPDVLPAVARDVAVACDEACA